MRIAFCLEQTTLAGGHKNVFWLANLLQNQGHDVVIYTIYPPDDSWVENNVVMVQAGSYSALERMMREDGRVHIATWWKTAPYVSKTGGGLYFCQDFETSYTNTDHEAEMVLATYEDPLLVRFTEASWVADEFIRHNLTKPVYIGQGVDHTTFYPRDGADKWQYSQVLFHERRHHLKGPQLRDEILRALKLGARDIRTQGYGPWTENPYADDHVFGPNDSMVAEIMRQSMCLLVTSEHEGFCLPALEAMACGLPVVTTDADANMEFCWPGENCLLFKTAMDAVEAIYSLHEDIDLWNKLRRGGIETAARYNWLPVISRLEALLKEYEQGKNRIPRSGNPEVDR